MFLIPPGYSERRARAWRDDMSQNRSRLQTVERVIIKGLECLVTLIASLLVVDVVVGVFTRYVLNSALPGTDELGGYLLGWLSFLGAALLCSEDGHISFELLVDSFPPHWQRPIVCGGYLIAIVFLGIVSYESIILMKDLQGSFGISIPVPKPLIYSVIPLGSAMGVLLLAFRAVAKWTEGD
jgi:TRAP-type C4-dicarboxylate transport system permease small subunit